MRVPAIVLALSFAVFLPQGPLAALVQDADVHEDRSELNVSAQAEVEVQPDRAVISFAVETEAESARAAGESNAVLMDRVLAAVRATELEGLRAETSGYSLTPRYSSTRSDMPREIVGYTARNHVLVTLDQVDEVGQIIDRALDEGANRVAGLQFQIRDPQPHREEALRMAVEQARAEAQAISAALGVSLGDPLEVQANASRPSGMESLQARGEIMAMSDVATPVEAGLQTVSASVSIRYRIHP